MRLVRGPRVRRRRRHRLRQALHRGARLTPPGDGARTAVVVVNWNNAELTTRAVRAVLDDGAADRVVVVDNGSTDGSADALRRDLPEATLVALPENGGFAVGANAGIRRADADVVVLLNNDAVPEPGFVTALRDHLTTAPADVAAVTGRIVLAGRWTRLPAGTTPPPGTRVLRDHDGQAWVPSPDGEERLNSTGVVVDRDGNGADRDWFAPVHRSAPVDVFGASGGASAFRRAALDDVGPLDESLFMYYEDTELAWRLRRRGWRVEYAADAVVRHDHSASSGVQSALFVERNARNRLVVALWHAPWGTVVRATVRTAARALRAAVTGDGREARLVSAALADVLAHLPRHLARRVHETRRASVPRRTVDPST